MLLATLKLEAALFCLHCGDHLHGEGGSGGLRDSHSCTLSMYAVSVEVPDQQVMADDSLTHNDSLTRMYLGHQHLCTHTSTLSYMVTR